MNSGLKNIFCRLESSYQSQFLGALVLSIIMILSVFQTSALSMTSFYVDPDFVGASKDGSASNPWSNVNNSSSWNAINSALAQDDVTVYFSARDSSALTDEDHSASGYLIVKRTDNSNYWLTLDGKSLYNQDDSNPDWVTNSSDRLSYINGGSHSIAWFSAQGKENRIRIKGFRLKGRFYIYGGDYLIIEENDIGDQLYFEYANYSQSHATNGGCFDIKIDNNIIHRDQDTGGEVIYFGGGGNSGLGGHTKIQITNNVVYGGNMNGGEGDGIDIKDENSQLLVKNNVVYNNAKRGITSLSPGIFEGNEIYSNSSGGLDLDSYWGNPWSDDIIIRNNSIHNNNSRGISILASNVNINSSAYIFNNSLYNNGNSSYPENIRVIGVSSLTLNNNVTARANDNLGPEVNVSGVSSKIVDYNNFYGNISGITRGPNGMNTDPLFKSITDLRPQASSPLIDSGVTLDGFYIDGVGVTRPQKISWDIGGYEFKDVAPSAPQNLRIIPDGN